MIPMREGGFSMFGLHRSGTGNDGDEYLNFRIWEEMTREEEKEDELLDFLEEMDKDEEQL